MIFYQRLVILAVELVLYIPHGKESTAYYLGTPIRYNKRLIFHKKKIRN